jgi:hypothetical protein
MEQRGTTSAKAAETRLWPPGSANRRTCPTLLHEGWTEQLAEHRASRRRRGHPPAGVDDITAALGHEPATRPTRKTVEAVFRVLAGEKGVSLDDWEIDERLAPTPGPCPSPCSDRPSPAGTPSAPWPGHSTSPPTRRWHSRPSSSSVTASSGSWPIRRTPDRQHPDEKRPDVVPATSGDRRYTTTELLAAEQRIIGSAWPHRRREPPGSPPAPSTTSWTPPHLDGEQADGVRALLTSGNGYDLVIGQAGTGKSTMLGAARAGWEEAGYKVIGTAVAARTAADLEAAPASPARRSPSSWPISENPADSPPGT